MMDRARFMQELEKLLADISETERQDALDFYNSYFDDAGAENEASVLRELGSPRKVAAIIKADLKGSVGKFICLESKSPATKGEGLEPLAFCKDKGMIDQLKESEGGFEVIELSTEVVSPFMFDVSADGFVLIG